MRIIFANIVLCVLCFLEFGCAGATGKVASKPDVNGIRYYRPATYYLVKPDYATESASVTKWTGPDTTTPYAIDPYAFLAKNNTEIHFDHGIMTSLSNDADSTKFATDVITAGAEIGKQVLAVAADAAKLGGIAAKESGADRPPIFLFKASGSGIVQLYPPSTK